MLIRLNKFLAQAGVASRREADRLIAQGRVEVNGEMVSVLGYKIDLEKDEVRVDGKRVKKQEDLIYMMLNKPAGCLVTLKDPFPRPTIKNLLPPLKTRVFPVGRLDYNSEGLLLLTNHGELAYRLTHPRFQIKKAYLVKVKGEPGSEELAELERGIYLDGQKTAPAKLVPAGIRGKNTLLRVEIYEGKKREIRRMFGVIGHPVLRLKRIKFDGLSLGKLNTGQWRYLTRREIDRLKSQTGLK
ncbi:MAG: pseudouridine synthase [Candidatus Aminicenantes bacterium]